VTDKTTGVARSVQTRLVRHAKELGVDPNLVLTRFALERFLYRLSRSPHAERFVLKGALLMLAWFGESLRPTRDADLLGFGDLTNQSLTQIFQSIATTDVPPDGMSYEPSSIRIRAIRPEDAYGGTRVTLMGRLGSPEPLRAIPEPTKSSSKPSSAPAPKETPLASCRSNLRW
jgi:hypothetical protein